MFAHSKFGENGRLSYKNTKDFLKELLQCLVNWSYNIRGPVAISNYEIAEILSGVVGKKIAYVDVSDNDARKGMKYSGIPDWTINPLLI